MKQSKPNKKVVIAAAVIQSVIVIIAGYMLFKAKFQNDQPTQTPPKKPHFEMTPAK